PVLERRGHHLRGRVGGEPPARGRREAGPELDRAELVAAPGQRHRRLPRPGPDLEDPGTGSEAGERLEVVEQLRRIAGSRAVVTLRLLVEDRPQAQRAVQPMSIVTGAPVKDFPPGPSRNATTSATSPGSIRRFAACGATMTFSSTSSSGRLWAFA